MFLNCRAHYTYIPYHIKMQKSKIDSGSRWWCTIIASIFFKAVRKCFTTGHPRNNFVGKNCKKPCWGWAGPSSSLVYSWIDKQIHPNEPTIRSLIWCGIHGWYWSLSQSFSTNSRWLVGGWVIGWLEVKEEQRKTQH